MFFVFVVNLDEQIIKVRTFWEAHKNLRNLPRALDIYLVNVESIRKIFSNFVCFSESLNFNCSKSCKYVSKFMCLEN